MPDQNANEQDQRRGGYGGSTGAENPAPMPETSEGASASGREGNLTNPADADEALGNRTGGYGGNPAAEDAGTSPDEGA